MHEAPLSRLFVAETEGLGYVCIWTWHHSLMDGGSRALLFAALARLPPPGEARDCFIQDEGLLPAERYLSWLSDRKPNLSDTFWRDTLTEYKQPTMLSSLVCYQQTEVGKLVLSPQTWCELDQKVSTRLREIAASLNVTLNNLMQATFALSLCVFQETDDIVFGVIRACRRTVPEGEKIISLLMNVLPFRVAWQPNMPLEALVRNVKATHLSLIHI